MASPPKLVRLLERRYGRMPALGPRGSSSNLRWQKWQAEVSRCLWALLSEVRRQRARTCPDCGKRFKPHTPHHHRPACDVIDLSNLRANRILGVQL
jgi:hypothetical protein